MKKTIKKHEPGPLRVLLLEDNPADAELIECELRRARIVFSARLTENKSEFSKALAEFRPQLILSDFKLPKFDGMAALKIARAQAPEIPFIFVSGSIGEEKAIEMLSLGASDYIFKDNLQRLGPAVKRTVEAARLKLEKIKTDKELQVHVEELRLLAEAADFFVQTNDLNKIYDYLAKVIREISGADYLLLTTYDEALQAVRPIKIAGGEAYYETIRRLFLVDPRQMVFYLKDMRQDDFSDFVSRRLLPVRDGLYGLANRKLPRPLCRTIEKLLAVKTMFSMGFSWENQLYGGVTVLFKKANEMKNHAQIETLLNQAAVSIKRLLAEKSLRASEERFRHISTTISNISYSCLPDTEGTYAIAWLTGATERIIGYTVEELLAMRCWGKLVLAEDIADFEKHVTGLTAGNSGICELRLRHKNGDIVWVQSFAECTQNPQQAEQTILYGGLVDISERKRMFAQLHRSEEYYRTLVQTSPDAIVIVDTGSRCTFASSKAYEIFGIPTQISIIGTSIMDFVEPEETQKVQERMVEILSGRSSPGIKGYGLRKHDGQPFWGEVVSAPLRDAQGRSTGLLLIIRDISERKRAEAALIESENKYRLIADNTAETISILDLNFKFTYVSPSIIKLRGYTVEEAMSSTLRHTLTPDSFAKIQEVFSEEMALEASGSANPKRNRLLELQEYHKDGSIVWVENSLSYIRNAQGNAIGFLAVSKDISERKLAEAKLLREKAFLERLVESAPEGIAITDCPGRVLQVNSEFVNMFGYTADEAIGKMIDDLVAPPEFLEEAGTLSKSSGQGEKIILETVRKRKDGVLLNVSIIGAPIFIADQQVAVYAIYRDISERKRTEEQIQFQAGLLQNVLDAIIATDQNSKIQVWNKAAEKIYGWKAEEAIGKKFHDVLKPGYCYQSREEVIETLDKEGVWSGEITHNLRDGKQIPVFSTITVLKNAGGGKTGLVSVNHDISERMQAEAQLRARDLLLQNLSAQVPGMIYTFMRRPDGTYCIPFSSNAIQDIFGVAPQAVIDDASAIFEPILAEDRLNVFAAIEHSAQTLSPWLAEYRVQLPGQPVRWMFGQSDPVRLEDGSILWYGFNSDITERKQAEELIRTSLKEKEVLLQEIHHRVKNNLQIISGLLTLQADQAAGKPMEDIFRESQDRIRSIALIHEKLYQSRNLAEIAFDEYLRALTENLFISQGVAAGRIAVKYEMEPIFFTIEKAIPLGLIVNELLTNSLKHAFPAGRQGEIRIGLHGYQKAKSFALKTESGTLHIVSTCELTVADNGIGLPAGQTPYQKKTLGMSLIFMLAKQLQAEIKVKSGPGTEFRLLFSGMLANAAAQDKGRDG